MRLKFIAVFFLLGSCTGIKAQSPAADLAGGISQRMKDSLNLSDSQRIALYVINMQLHNRKMNVRLQYTNGDSLQHYTQRVENTRDSLYENVLSPEQYLLYQEKKRNLLKAN